MVTDGGIQARREYGGLVLLCDEPSFRHILTVVQDAAGSARYTGAPPTAAEMRYISIRLAAAECEPQRNRLGFWSLAHVIFAGGASATIFVVGVITIVQWLSQYFD